MLAPYISLYCFISSNVCYSCLFLIFQLQPKFNSSHSAVALSAGFVWQSDRACPPAPCSAGSRGTRPVTFERPEDQRPPLSCPAPPPPQPLTPLWAVTPLLCPLTMRMSERLEQVCPAVLEDREISISLAWLNCLLLVRGSQVSGMWPRDAGVPAAETARPLGALGPRG